MIVEGRDDYCMLLAAVFVQAAISESCIVMQKKKKKGISGEVTSYGKFMAPSKKTKIGSWY